MAHSPYAAVNNDRFAEILRTLGLPRRSHGDLSSSSISPISACSPAINNNTERVSDFQDTHQSKNSHPKQADLHENRSSSQSSHHFQAMHSSSDSLSVDKSPLQHALQIHSSNMEDKHHSRLSSPSPSTESPSPSLQAALDALPRSSQNSSPRTGPVHNPLFKTELCRSWEEFGTCRYGNKCQFAHGSEELHPVQRHPKYKTEVCRTFATTGTCPYGTRCRFIHENPTLDQLNTLLRPSSGGSGIAGSTTAALGNTTPRSSLSQPATPLTSSTSSFASAFATSIVSPPHTPSQPQHQQQQYTQQQRYSALMSSTTPPASPYYSASSSSLLSPFTSQLSTVNTTASMNSTTATGECQLNAMLSSIASPSPSTSVNDDRIIATTPITPTPTTTTNASVLGGEDFHHPPSPFLTVITPTARQRTISSNADDDGEKQVSLTTAATIDNTITATPIAINNTTNDTTTAPLSPSQQLAISFAQMLNLSTTNTTTNTTNNNTIVDDNNAVASSLFPFSTPTTIHTSMSTPTTPTAASMRYNHFTAQQQQQQQHEARQLFLTNNAIMSVGNTTMSAPATPRGAFHHAEHHAVLTSTAQHAPRSVSEDVMLPFVVSPTAAASMHRLPVFSNLGKERKRNDGGDISDDEDNEDIMTKEQRNNDNSNGTMHVVEDVDDSCDYT